MAHESRSDIERALLDLGWEIQDESEGADAVIGGHEKYRLMVSLEEGKPTSVIVSYVGRGGEILSSKWAGVERLPSPESVVRALSRK